MNKQDWSNMKGKKYNSTYSKRNLEDIYHNIDKIIKHYKYLYNIKESLSINNNNFSCIGKEFYV
jgi:alkyl hydroperoxide reductase subunit AhpC